MFREDARIGNLWGIPILGYLVRYLVLIPHVIALALLGILVALASLFTWIPVLLLGRYPSWGYTIVGGFLRWYVRVIAYLWLLSGSYPAFSLSDEPGQHVQVPIAEDVRINRFWGIPILGIAVRAITLIPHLIVLWCLSVVSGLLLVFAWIPVLLLGRQAELVYLIVGGYLRWSVRVGAYLMLMTDRYPPFSLTD